jgi:hypothetical protein
MKRIVCVLTFLLVWTFGFGQEINFINELAGKKTVTFDDAVKMYMYTLGKAPAGFGQNVAALKVMGLLKAKDYDKDKPIRRGMLALMVARHLKLKGSLFYLMFDMMSGDELLEVMAIVSERTEEKQ